MMDAHKRAEIRHVIETTIHPPDVIPTVTIRTVAMVALLDHMDVLDDEVRRLRADLVVAAEDLRRMYHERLG